MFLFFFFVLFFFSFGRFLHRLPKENAPDLAMRSSDSRSFSGVRVLFLFSFVLHLAILSRSPESPLSTSSIGSLKTKQTKRKRKEKNTPEKRNRSTNLAITWSRKKMEILVAIVRRLCCLNISVFFWTKSSRFGFQFVKIKVDFFQSPAASSSIGQDRWNESKNSAAHFIVAVIVTVSFFTSF